MMSVEILAIIRALELMHATTGLTPPVLPRNALRRDGSSQSGRFPAALGEGYFQIDERGLEDFLTFTLKMAATVRFDDGIANSSKDWRPFFKKDVSVLLATVLRYPLGEWRGACEKMLANLRTDLDAMRKLVLSINSPEVVAFREGLQNLISLVDQGDTLVHSPHRELAVWVQDLNGIPEFQSDFDRVQRGVVDRQLAVLAQVKQAVDALPQSGNDIQLALEPILPQLTQVVTVMADAIAALQTRSKAQFARSLADYPRHSPHMGLFIAFLQVHRHAQGRLNALGPAHLDFYYRQVLRFAPQQAQPDQVHLIGQLGASAQRLLLPAGTRFAAADKRVYATTRDWNLSQAKVGKMMGLRRHGNDRLLLQQAGEGHATGLWPAHPGMDVSVSGSWGWAVASPMLRLGGGLRQVFLAFGFTPSTVLYSNVAAAMPALKAGLEVQLSGAKGWLVPSSVGVSWIPAGSGMHSWFLPQALRMYDCLQVSLVLNPEDEAIVDVETNLHPGLEAAGFPAAMFRLSSEGNADLLDLLTQLQPKTWGIGLSVEAWDAPMQNQEGSMVASRPSPPFGQQPTVGSKLWIDVTEGMSKNPLLYHVDFKLDGWPDQKPVDYFEAYSTYLTEQKGTPTKIEAGDFLARPTMLVRGEATSVTFDPVSASLYDEVGLNYLRADQVPSAQVFKDLAGLGKSMRNRSLRDGIFLELALAGPSIAFGHAAYPLVNARAMYLMSKYLSEKAAGNEPTDSFSDADLPNPPVQLTVEKAHTLYVAGLQYGDGQADGEGPLYQIGGFGHRKISLGGTEGLLPADDFGAALYWGLEAVASYSQLTLFVELLPGSGALSLEMPKASWAYLAGDEWVPFGDSGIVADTTNGLRRSGILVFNIGALPGLDHRLMPQGLYWLRMRADGDAAAFDRIAATALNGFAATLETNPDGVVGTLTANSINRPLQYLAGLQAVTQPFGSFGGAKVETDLQFQARVAERLRHKERSQSLWDYEKMVLGRFAEVDQVKCIDHCAPLAYIAPATGEAWDQELAPGHVTVVCIPKTPDLLAINPLQPQCRRDLLAGIAEQLQAEVPPFVTVHCVNPLYKEIAVSGLVVFHPTVDAGAALEWLQTAIARYLCPWAFVEGQGIRFGGKVHRSQLIHLIEQEPYVDVVANFKMMEAGSETDMEWIEATASRMVIVPAQMQGLVPTTLEELNYIGSQVYGGIGFWRVNQDFVVNGN